jgi:hypothetical protein
MMTCASSLDPNIYAALETGSYRNTTELGSVDHGARSHDDDVTLTGWMMKMRLGCSAREPEKDGRTREARPSGQRWPVAFMVRR